MESLVKDILSSNSSVSLKQQELQKLAYYGKFLALPDFDDGWKYQMQQQLLKYLANLDFSGEENNVNLEVEKVIENEKGEIFAILKSESLTPETEEKILEISTLLQRKFHMTSVQQKVGFGASENGKFKVVLEDLNIEDIGYERMKYQKVYAQIIYAKDKLKRIETQIDISTKEDNEHIKLLSKAMIEIKNNLQDEIEYLEKELEQLDVILQYTINLKEDNTPTTKITKFQADSVVEISNDTKDHNVGALNIIKKAEEILEANSKQNAKFYKKIEALLDFKGIETAKTTKGLLTDVNIGHGYLIKAKILDAKNSNVYFHDGKIHGFEIEDLDKDISRIEVIGKQNGIITTFVAELINGNKVLYNTDGEGYVPFEIENNKEFKNFEIRHFESFNNWIAQRGTGTNIDEQNFYIYNSNGKIKVLEIEGNIYFDGFNHIKYTQGSLSSGKVIINHKKSYFHKEGQNFKFLEIEGEKLFDEIDELKNDNNGNIISGRVKIDNKESYFYKEGGNFKFIEIEGENFFDQINYLNHDNHGYIISGRVKIDNKESYFYKERGIFKFIYIEGEKSFDNIYNVNLDVNGKPLYGIYGEENGKIFILDKKTGKYIRKTFFMKNPYK